jgi:hypothetical protein
MRRKTMLFFFVFVCAGVISGCTNVYKVQNLGITELNNEKHADDKTQYAADEGSKFKIIKEQTNDYLLKFDFVEGYYTASEIAQNMAQQPTMPIGNANTHDVYKISKSNLDDYQYSLEHGTTVGLLVIPFKFEYDGTLAGGGTIGPYLGYQKEMFGILPTFFASVGLTSIATQDVNSKEVNNLSGLTGAFGVSFPVKKMQLGLVGGWDHLGGSAGKNWQYENRFWMSVAFGFNFLQ